MALEYALARAAAGTFAFVLNTLRLTAHGLAKAAVHGFNWFFRQLVLFLRRVRMSLVCAARAMRRAGAECLVTGPRTVRIVLLPVAALLVAGGLLRPVADGTRDYLTTGGFAALGIALAGSLGCLLLWTAGWAALSGQPFGPVRASARRAAESALPQVVMLAAVGGWVLGLPGLFGYGRIRVGWITGGLTVTLLAVYLRRRPGREAPLSSGASGASGSSAASGARATSGEGRT